MCGGRTCDCVVVSVLHLYVAMDMPETPVWTDAADAGARLGVSAQTMHRWADEGALPDGSVLEVQSGSRVTRRFWTDLIEFEMRPDMADRRARRGSPHRPSAPAKSRKATGRRRVTTEEALERLNSI